MIIDAYASIPMLFLSNTNYSLKTKFFLIIQYYTLQIQDILLLL